MPLPPERFYSKEKDLQEKIKSGEYPFLGLFADDLQTETRDIILYRLNRKQSPVGSFASGMLYFPALLSTYLVIHLMEGFGNTGIFDVYSHIKRAIGTDIPLNQRQLLWDSFRSACLSLGLSVSPKTSGSHYMANEYLRQTGIPLNYISTLTDKMLKYSIDVGLPDEDDTDAIKLWQEGLLARLTPPFPQTARQAFELDENGYYVQLFTRLLHQREVRVRGASKVEDLMLDVIQGGGHQGKTKHISIPQIVLRDYQMGIILPEGTWTISTGEETKRIISREDSFFPFENKLIFNVRVKKEKINTPWTYSLWQDEKDNRLLIFSGKTGRFLRSVTLAEEDIYLPPGDYSLLLRFKPENGEPEKISSNPEMYMEAISLNPAETFSITRGPAKLDLQADNVPTINWKGNAVRGEKGEMLYPSGNLALEIFIPKEYLTLHADPIILLLKSNTFGEKAFKIKTDSRERFSVDLIDVFSSWEPGVSRVLAELKRQNSQRVLTRNAVVVWNGLKSIERKVLFHCARLPENLDEKVSDNLLVRNDERVITYENDMNRFFRMIFNDDKRKLVFTWMVPGVFLILEKYTAGGVREYPVKIGATLPVSSASRDVLRIAASDDAVLQLGSFSKRASFSRISATKIPLASLVEYVGPAAHTLNYRNENTGNILPLVNIVAPHEARVFSIEAVGGQRKIHFQLHDNADALRIRARNLLDDNSTFLEIYPTSMSTTSHSFMNGGKTTIFAEEAREFDLYISADGWEPGLWLIDIEVKINNRWGLLSNGHGEVCLDGMIINHAGRIGVWRDIVDFLDTEESDIDFLSLFKRVHEAVVIPFDSDSDNNICWLEESWRWLSQKVSEKADREDFRELLRFSLKYPEKIIPARENPYRRLGAYFPQIYCFERSFYEKITKENNVLKCLMALPILEAPFPAFQEGMFDQLAFLGFKNAQEAYCKMINPSGFDIATYKLALEQSDISDRWRRMIYEDWMPGEGDYLGAMHYQYALSKLKSAYDEIITINAERIGRIMGIAGYFSSKRLSDYHHDCCPAHLCKDIHLALLDGTLNTELMPDEELQNRENMCHIIHFISLFAQICRMESRCSGSLKAFMLDIAKYLQNYGFADEYYRRVLGFILHVGEDMFLFYLLLWELALRCDYDNDNKESVHASR